jgi:hypothetical protein
MDWLDKTTIQLGAQVTSTLVALLALFIGLRNKARNQKRFERQLSLSQQAAGAAARPLLAIEREGYTADFAKQQRRFFADGAP